MRFHTIFVAPDGVGEDDVSAVPIPDEEGVPGRSIDDAGGLNGRRLRCWFPGCAVIRRDFDAFVRNAGEAAVREFDER